MFTLGVYTKEQYARLGEKRRFLGARVAYNLLRVQEPCSAEEAKIFEDICFTLRTSNGTFRTTYRNRFRDVDKVALRLIQGSFDASTRLRVQDRAVSNGLTSAEWARGLGEHYPTLEFEASDLLIELREWTLPNGDIYIGEPDGKPLQYIRRPFVVSQDYKESWRNPLLRWVANRARHRFNRLSSGGYRTAPISCIHPEARELEKSGRFRFEARSIFDRTPKACEVLRTMNILNRSYFSSERLAEAARGIFDSLVPGGIWIAGRTLEEDFSNHVTFFRRLDDRWEVLERIGNGLEIEEIALASVKPR